MNSYFGIEMAGRNLRSIDEPWEGYEYPYIGLWSEEFKFDTEFRIVRSFRRWCGELGIEVEFKHGERRGFPIDSLLEFEKKKGVKIDWSSIHES